MTKISAADPASRIGGRHLTEKERSNLDILCRSVGWTKPGSFSPGLRASVCASLVRKGLAERMIHSEHVRYESRTQWTEYRATDAGRAEAGMTGDRRCLASGRVTAELEIVVPFRGA